ncbi:hypothetical protein N665_0343s0003 [Sinapis alba]|nr:hypothetical protein N665_0343s0003 [Sinapis alba]
MKRLPVALLLILLAFFSSNFHTDGHVDLQTSMEKSIGGSLRRIPKSRYSPIQNKRDPSRNQKTTSREP